MPIMRGKRENSHYVTGSVLRRAGRRARHPFIGLATVLVAVLVFLVFLVALTALVHWVVM